MKYHGFVYVSPVYRDLLYQALCISCYRCLFTRKVGFTPSPKQREVLGLAPVTLRRDARTRVCMECGNRLVPYYRSGRGPVNRYFYKHYGPQTWLVLDRKAPLEESRMYDGNIMQGTVVGEFKTRQEARDFCNALNEGAKGP